MRIYLISILCYLITISCVQLIDSDSNEYDFIPNNSNIIITVKNVSKFKNSILNNEYLKSIISYNDFTKELLKTINSIDSKEKIVIAIHEETAQEKINFDIIGRNISADSLKNKLYNSVGDIDIISSDLSSVPKTNKTHFINKYEKINQTNQNFSIAFDSILSTRLTNEIFKTKVDISNNNLILNVDATNNVVFINGILDNKNLNIDKNEKFLDFEELKNTYKNVFIDFDQDLTNEYDLISLNNKQKIKIIPTDSLQDFFKIFQLTKGADVFSFNGLISKYNYDPNLGEFNTIFKTTIKNEIITGPIIVKNYTNNLNEIIIQDSENILYLINNNGQVEWSKKIEGKIIGEIHQIDSFKNGRLQYVFATKKSLYLLDSKGKDVGKFPLKFKDEITKPLSVFDYDNNKNYRLLITQNNQLFMFDSKGNRVKGFDYKKKNKIVTKPKHFRIKDKDVIVFKTIEKLNILNRRGAIRINTKTNHTYSDEEIFNYQDFLLTTTEKNEIIKIDMKGNTTIDEPLAINSKIISDKKRVFTLQKNILSNSINTFEIEFGKYQSFKIYDGANSSYLNIFDSQNNKIYLFDDELNLVKGFPVFSEENGDFIIDKKRIEFCIKTENKQIKFQSVK